MLTKKKKDCVLAIIAYSSIQIWMSNVIWAIRNEFECWYNVRNENLNFFAFFKRRRDCEQKFNIWHFFCNDENVYEIDFRIQMFVDNDDKYERSIWNRWKIMHFKMRKWSFARKSI